jgi:nucleoside-diphosphate-sugar epimerase
VAKIGTVLVTGAAGFVGRRVVADLARSGWSVRAVVRRAVEACGDPAVTWLPLGDLAELDDWSAALTGVDAVVHLAGRAHVMDDPAPDPLAAFRRTNVVATMALADAAATAGVHHFVFMSSIKAVGEQSALTGLAEDAECRPEDAYGVSKREAEVALLAPGRLGAMAVTILRPPLVYGPGVRANFARLLGWVARRIPLPFGAVDNRRSLVFVGNLSSAVAFVLRTPALAGQTCLVSDGEAVSTPELVRQMAAALGRAPRLLPVPPIVLNGLLHAVGKGAEAGRLLGSLVLRDTRLRAAGWAPPFSMAQGLVETAQAHARCAVPGASK